MSARVRRPGRPFSLLGRAMILTATLVLAGCVGTGGLPVGGAGAPDSPQAGGSGAPAGSTTAGTCPTRQPASLAAGQTRTVTIITTKGTIVIKVDGALAPVATGNFVALATCGYYTGVVFNRLVPGFVIQGGDGQFGRVGADGKLSASQAALIGSGNPGYTIADDPVRTDYARGTVAMARTPDAHSEGAQFFIVLTDAAAQSLAQSNQYGYAIIGKITTGMDSVDAIAALPNSGDPNNEAVDPVPMTSVTVGP